MSKNCDHYKERKDHYKKLYQQELNNNNKNKNENKNTVVVVVGDKKVQSCHKVDHKSHCDKENRRRNCSCSKCNPCPRPPGNCEFCENADLLDGLDSTQFLRSDTSGTLDGDLTINGNLEVTGDYIQFPQSAVPPFMCNATTAGTVFFNTTLGKLQVCNGTNFETISSS